MLTAALRKALKAKAHRLDPVVHVGAKGVTDEVIAEIDRALQAHELIKVRAASLDRIAREEAFDRIVEKTGADAVQHIGKVFVLFRKKPDA
jgi:RNA-binding protein